MDDAQAALMDAAEQDDSSQYFQKRPRQLLPDFVTDNSHTELTFVLTVAN